MPRRPAGSRTRRRATPSPPPQAAGSVATASRHFSRPQLAPSPTSAGTVSLSPQTPPQLCKERVPGSQGPKAAGAAAQVRASTWHACTPRVAVTAAPHPGPAPSPHLTSLGLSSPPYRLSQCRLVGKGQERERPGGGGGAHTPPRSPNSPRTLGLPAPAGAAAGRPVP